MSIIKNIVYKKKYLPGNKPKALCFFFDGKFDNEFAEINDIELYGNEELSVYKWDKNLRNKNIVLFKKEDLEKYSYDFIIFNSINTFEKHILSLPRHLHVPAVIFQHEDHGMTNFHLQEKLKTFKVDFLQDVPYAINPPKKDVDKDIDILIAGMFQEQDYKIIDRIKQEIPNLIVIGNNPGLSYSVPMSNYESYKELFYRTKIYINLTTQRSINYEALWALSGNAKVIGFKLKELEKIQQYMILCENMESLINSAKREISNLNNSTISNNKEKILKQFSIEDMKKLGNLCIEKYCNKVFKYE